MSVDELSTRYMNLRSALASAYGQPVWDSGEIDSLTDAISDTEYALAASGATAGSGHLSDRPASRSASGIAFA